MSVVSGRLAASVTGAGILRSDNAFPPFPFLLTTILSAAAGKRAAQLRWTSGR